MVTLCHWQGECLIEYVGYGRMDGQYPERHRDNNPTMETQVLWTRLKNDNHTLCNMGRCMELDRPASRPKKYEVKC